MKKLSLALLIGSALMVFLLSFGILSANSVFSLEVSPEIDTVGEQTEIAVPTLSAGMIPRPTPESKVAIRTLSAANAYQQAYDDLYTAMANIRTSCSLSRYQMDRETVSDLFSDVINHSPELFYVDGRLGISYNRTTGIVSSVSFTYTMNESKIGQASAFYYAEIDRILAQLPDPDMSDLDKALWLHDYICVRYAYDSKLTNYDAYTFFRDRRGVCQGYTLAYMALMKACGIRTDFAASSDMNHIWNLIELDGAWYHVDLTWDDPVHSSGSDIPGRVGHDNFLCSDQALIRTGHYNWDSHVCDSTLYDGAYLDTIQSAFAYLDGEWYCVDRQDGGVRLLQFPAMETKLVFKVDGIWYRWNDTRYYVYSYVNLCGVNGKLYYSTPTAIGCYDPINDSCEELTAYTGGEGYIYALFAEKNTLHYWVTKAPGGEAILEYTYEIEDTGPTDPIPTDPPGTDGPPDEYVEYLNLTCGEDPAAALISLVSGEEGQSVRILMIANVSRLSACADPVFSVRFERGGDSVFRYNVTGKDLIFYQSITDGSDRFTAAEGYVLFGVTVDRIPTGAWTSAEIVLTDGATGQVIGSHTVENAVEE